MSNKYPNAPLCPTCGTRQKPLFTGWFCPLECDRKPLGPKVDDEWDVPTQPYGSKLVARYVEKWTWLFGRKGGKNGC